MEMKSVGATTKKTVQVEVEVPTQVVHRKKKTKLGFTNGMGICLILMLWTGLAGSFLLAWRSITYQYTGALACWTVVFTPIGTALGIVLAAIVQKNKAENTSATGEGIVFASAQSKNFNNQDDYIDYVGTDSPPI